MSEKKEEATWVSVQRRAFLKWVNNYLKKKGFDAITVEIEAAWDDGIKLMELIHALYDVPIPRHNKKPRMRPQQADNLAIAFKMMEEAKVKTNFLMPHQLMDHNLKMILGMVWAVILDYAIKGISVGEATAKEGLLLWVQKKTKGYRDVDPPGVRNFHKSWKDGMALCALIHRHEPGLIPYDTLDKKNAAQNLELAFRVAEEHLEIPRLLEVEDLTESARPDERSVMTYISEFFHRFASYSIKENAARRVAKFIEFARRMKQSQADYENQVRQLVQWTQEQIQFFEGKQFGNTLDDAIASMQEFRAYLTEQKPKRLGEKLDIDAIYAEIQTELTVNSRPVYTPPDDCSPEAISAAFRTLSESENVYSQSVRDYRFRFIERKEVHISEEKVAEIRESFNHFDANGSNDLDVVEFKAALMALGVPFKDDNAVAVIFAEVAGGAELMTFEQYMAYNLELAEDRDTPEQILASFKLLADDAESVTAEQLALPPMTDEDVEYLKSMLPQNEDGSYNYASFVQSAYVQ